jgi:hypothetical protein
MKPWNLNPLTVLNEGLRKAHIRLIIKVMDFAESPAQRALMQLSASVTLVGLSAGAAYAQSSEGVAGMVSTGADQGDSVKLSASRLFAAAGFIGAGWGAYNWIIKTKEGPDSRIKASQVFGPIAAGVVLGSIGYVMVKTGETVGIKGSSQGQLPN